jgi:hypothetical protein
MEDYLKVETGEVLNFDPRDGNFNVRITSTQRCRLFKPNRVFDTLEAANQHFRQVLVQKSQQYSSKSAQLLTESNNL